MRLKIRYKIFEGRNLIGYFVYSSNTESYLVRREAILQYREYFDGVVFTSDGLVSRAKYNIGKCQVGQIKGLYKDSNCNLVSFMNSRIYDGVSKKFGITIQGHNYIVKQGESRTAYSEYVASTFIRKLGFDAHLVELTDFSGDIVAVVKDFTTDKLKLRSFRALMQASEDEGVFYAYTYDNILQLISDCDGLTNCLKRKAECSFWHMYLLDAILANSDRHAGNWGFLVGKNGWDIAPIYDNGLSLYPYEDLGDYVDKFNVLQRVMKSGAVSSIKRYSETIKRTCRTEYREVISSGRYSGLAEQVTLFRAFGLQKIHRAIQESVTHYLIPEVYQRFYVDIVCLRYLYIVLGFSLGESFEILSGLEVSI